mmetsp:Transcript_11284/g.37299  ORF Transcript_11284/g.37299 Transcript_11284/m.37299 type:complete len:230 (+) Transcript_11284:1533-2222(+)
MPLPPVTRHMDNEMLAELAHRKLRHITFLLQYVEASSRENKTPPIGAPNAAARPAAAPALMNSLCVVCDPRSRRRFWKPASFWWRIPLASLIGPTSLFSSLALEWTSSSPSSSPTHRSRPARSHFIGPANTKQDATAAPMCTIGPSGPTASPEPTAHVTPTAFASKDLNPNSPGTLVPLRNAITPVTPPPAACGAQKTQSTEATATNTTHISWYQPIAFKKELSGPHVA